jgi:hypothetical protein
VEEHIEDPRLADALRELRERLAARGRHVARLDQAGQLLDQSGHDHVSGSRDGQRAGARAQRALEPPQ